MGNEIYTIRMPDVKKKRKVLIVGGGPGGMQAAVTAAERGHEVILCEKSDKLGGKLKFTDFDCHKEALCRFKNWLVREVGKNDIDVRLNTEVTAALIEKERPYAVIVAVGSDSVVPPIPGIDKGHVLHAYDSYFDQNRVGKSVVMVGGGMMGVEVGLHFADSDRKVTIIEMTDELARDANPIHKAALEEMLELKCDTRLKTTVLEIADDGVRIKNAEGAEETIPCDTVIYAVGVRPRRETVEALRAADGYGMFMSVGDTEWGSPFTPKCIHDAIHGGYFAAMDII
jgi:pyruvate/2-oxoglutarate dehydrogenase complex dihydrolipoamide dehydrogenase (E3) component